MPDTFLPVGIGKAVLRSWTPGDRQPFRDLCADARVMEFFPAPLAQAESDAVANTLSAALSAQGWGVWVLDVPEAGGFAGIVGLKQAPAALPFAPCVEVMWRLRAECWGRGYATQAAKVAMDHGFRQLKLAEIVAFTALPNLRSQGVMDRLGMVMDGEFDHPVLPQGHWLRRHVLCRKKAP